MNHADYHNDRKYSKDVEQYREVFSCDKTGSVDNPLKTLRTQKPGHLKRSCYFKIEATSQL